MSSPWLILPIFCKANRLSIGGSGVRWGEVRWGEVRWGEVRWDPLGDRWQGWGIVVTAWREIRLYCFHLTTDANSDPFSCEASVLNSLTHSLTHSHSLTLSLSLSLSPTTLTTYYYLVRGVYASRRNKVVFIFIIIIIKLLLFSLILHLYYEIIWTHSSLIV